MNNLLHKPTFYSTRPFISSPVLRHSYKRKTPSFLVLRYKKAPLFIKSQKSEAEGPGENNEDHATGEPLKIDINYNMAVILIQRFEKNSKSKPATATPSFSHLVMLCGFACALGNKFFQGLVLEDLKPLWKFICLKLSSETRKVIKIPALLRRLPYAEAVIGFLPRFLAVSIIGYIIHVLGKRF